MIKRGWGKSNANVALSLSHNIGNNSSSHCRDTFSQPGKNSVLEEEKIQFLFWNRWKLNITSKYLPSSPLENNSKKTKQKQSSYSMFSKILRTPQLQFWQKKFQTKLFCLIQAKIAHLPWPRSSWQFLCPNNTSLPIPLPKLTHPHQTRSCWQYVPLLE